MPPGPCEAPKVASLGSLHIWGPVWLDFQALGRQSLAAGDLSSLSALSGLPRAGLLTKQKVPRSAPMHTTCGLASASRLPSLAQLRHWSLLLASRLLC